MRSIFVSLMMIALVLVACADRAATKRKTASRLIPPTDKPIYVCQKAPRQVIIDGNLEEWKGAPPILLAYRYLSPEDLSVQARLMWDDRFLYVACATKDNVFNQPYSGSGIWRGDGVQLAFDPLEDAKEPGYGPDDHELGLALAHGKPMAWRWHGQGKGLIEDIQLAIRATGHNGDALYEAAIPWTALPPLNAAHMRTCGFTLSVNDNDGCPWEGFSYLTYSKDNRAGLWKGNVQWTPGIMPKKDPTQFGTLVFEASTARAGEKPEFAKAEEVPADLEQIDLDRPLATSSCSARDFDVKGRLVPSEQSFVGQASLTIVNESANVLDGPWLGFCLWPEAEVSSVEDEQARSLHFEGPKRFEIAPLLMTVRVQGPLPPGGTRRLTFVYKGVFDGRVSNHIGPHNSWLLRESYWYPLLGSAPDEARQSSKGPLTMAITVPDTQMVVSEGELVEVQKAPDGITCVWRSEQLPFGFTAATYDKITETIGGTSVTVWVYPDHRNGAKAVAKMTADFMGFYGKKFGPYPHDAFAIAEVDRRGGYGSVPMLLNPGNFETEPNGRLLAHELAHRWWDQLGPVQQTMGEGFADYSAAVAMQELYGRQLPVRDWQRQYAKAIGRDPPIVELDPYQDYTIYRAVAYTKGPYILHMLRYVMGEEAFFAALRTFYARCRAESELVSLGMFQEIAHQACGRHLSEFFDQWLRQVVVPDYAFGTVEVEQSEAGYVTTVIVKNQGAGTMPVSVVLATEDQTLTQEITLGTEAEAALSFTSEDKPKALEIDPQKWILQSRIDNDRYEFETPEEIQVQRIPLEELEELEAVGRVTSSNTDEEAIRELVEFYQQPGLDTDRLALLWSPEGAARCFGDSYSPGTGEARKRSQLPEGVKRDKMALVIGEKAGQMVAEVRIAGSLLSRGKEITGRALYLLSKSDDGRWRLINFDVSF